MVHETGFSRAYTGGGGGGLEGIEGKSMHMRTCGPCRWGSI